MDNLILLYQKNNKKNQLSEEEEIKILYQIAKGVLNDVEKYFDKNNEKKTVKILLERLNINNMFLFFEYIKHNNLQKEYPNVFKLFSLYEEDLEKNEVNKLTTFEVLYFQVYEILKEILKKGEHTYERN